MTPAAAAILEGMPDPRDLRRVSADGQTLIFAGSRLLFRYRDDDTGARNVAVAVLRQLGYGGPAVGAGMGPTGDYLATLHPPAPRGGTRGGGPPPGPPRAAGPGGVGAGPRGGGRRVGASGYAAAMLLPAFAGGAGAGQILAAAAGGEPAGVALLSAVSLCFALGAATLEQFKHLAAADAGPLAGLAALPDLRTIRPRLAAIPDGTDPVAVQRLFASAMLAADPDLARWYYVHDHFGPYAGSTPATMA